MDAEAEQIYAELYRQHEARALRTAFALLADRAAAEDAVQEAFVVAFRTLPRKRPDVSFGTWLYRCLAWAARGHQRRRPQGEVLTATPAVQHEPAELERSDLRFGLVAALAELPRAYREVLVLRYYLDFSEDVTAAMLGCRRGTVKSRAHRGLRLVAASGHLSGYHMGGHTNAQAGA